MLRKLLLHFRYHISSHVPHHISSLSLNLSVSTESDVVIAMFSFIVLDIILFKITCI